MDQQKNPSSNFLLLDRDMGALDTQGVVRLLL